MKLLTIIPAYNEEQTISNVISKIKLSQPNLDILVVNDGSKDNTSVNALKSGAQVINLPFNLGIGGAMQTGYLYAYNYNYDIAIQVDGDGQHDPYYINQLIQPIISNEADMVIGSRYIKSSSYKSSIFRRIGMVFFSNLIRLLTGNNLKDTTSGFRAVNKKVICFFSNNYPSDYPEVDVLIKLHKKNFRVTEIPVEMLSRQGGKSSITPLKSIYYMIKVSLCLIIGSFRTVKE